MDQIWSLNTLSAAESHLAESKSEELVIENYVDGEFIPASTSKPSIDIINPKTGRKFGRVHISDEQDIETAIEAAKGAFKSWSKTKREVRANYLRRIADIIVANHELFCVWESLDQGKTFDKAKMEIDRAAANFRYFASYILHEETTVRMIDGVALTYEHRSPAGVFALISPWNMPLYLLTWKIAPCIAFGCTAVAKPSEITSVTAYMLAEVFRRAELPKGVVNLVFGDGKTTGSTLIKHPAIQGISFTGGTATGIQIRKDTVTQIYKHLSLELGGKNPTLVFDDVDIDKAVQIAATAAFENQGEICLCGSRIYVQKSIYKGFLTKFTSYVAETYTRGTKLGALASLGHYQKVRSYLVLAEKEKAKFELGSIPPDDPKEGYWIEPPVILTGLSQSSRVVQEEIFGPVATIIPFETEEEAIELANDNANGLASVLLTRDGARMRRVGEQIDAGLVWINTWLVRELGTPFGGMKNSGTGREGGSYSRDVFTNVRTLHLPA